MPIRYGKQVVITDNGDVVTTEESVFANFNTVKKVTIMTETIRVANEKEILAEFLKLMDRWQAGEIDLPGIQTIRDRQGNMRIDVNWTISD